MKKVFILIGLSLALQAVGQVVNTKPNGQKILMFGKAQSIYDTLSQEAKLYGLSTFWKEASYNFVFFDKVRFNWDSMYYAYLPKVAATKNLYEYWMVLSQFASTLKDGHTSVYKPDFFWKDIGTPPIQWTLVDNKRFIARIDERLLTEIPLGTEVLACNDLSFDDYAKKGNSIVGIKGSPLTFTFKRKDGKEFKKEVLRIAGKDRSVKYYPSFNLSTEFDFKILDNNIAYFKINTFSNDSIPIKFRKEISKANKSKAVIIDVRENGGGNTDYAIDVAQHLVDKPFMVGSAWRTRIHKAANKAWGSMSMYGDTSEWTKKNFQYLIGNEWENHPGDTILIDKSIYRIQVPIFVLIGANTFSAAEDFLILLDGSKNIKLIGQPTAGSSGQPLIFELPMGLSGRVCAKRDTYPDGRDFIGIGIKPDIYVKKSVDDFKNGIDAELKVAVDQLNKKLKSN